VAFVLVECIHNGVVELGVVEGLNRGQVFLELGQLATDRRQVTLDLGQLLGVKDFACVFEQNVVVNVLDIHVLVVEPLEQLVVLVAVQVVVGQKLVQVRQGGF